MATFNAIRWQVCGMHHSCECVAENISKTQLYLPWFTDFLTCKCLATHFISLYNNIRHAMYYKIILCCKELVHKYSKLAISTITSITRFFIKHLQVIDLAYQTCRFFPCRCLTACCKPCKCPSRQLQVKLFFPDDSRQYHGPDIGSQLPWPLCHYVMHCSWQRQ
jgi:hypothetical protein